MRIVVHDYSGHPGQADLSRALARRGHHVVHQHCPLYTTGKGSLQRVPGDPPSLSFEACAVGSPFARYAVARRIVQELRYGHHAAGRIAAQQPDVAVLSNVPLLAHAVAAWRLRRRGIPMVFWHQDIYSAAIGQTARRQLPPVAGPAVAGVADRVERAVARASMAVVAISPVFLPTLTRWGVDGRSTVVPNWAPIAELPVRPRVNRWSDAQGLSSVPVVLYAGTLGLKHDPSVLAALADHLGRSRPEARVVVVSEGRGRRWLDDWRRQHGADNLVLLDFQPYEDLPDVLATGDVLVALLEPGASAFSVPSKVLTYLCAGRPVVGVLPAGNSVADILDRHRAGVVVEPGDRGVACDVVDGLLGDRDARRRLGEAGRRYAEETFSADTAAERFEEVFATAVHGSPDRVAEGAAHPVRPERARRRRSTGQRRATASRRRVRLAVSPGTSSAQRTGRSDTR